VKDQILEPVKSSFGWHIIQFIDRQVPATSRMSTIEAGAAAGEDFAALAKQFSETSSKDQGGDIGWVARYQLDSIKESAIFKAAIGGLTPVITVSDGLYLFKVVAEEVRLPDADQAEELKSSAFGNWYTARKNESTIVRDYQTGTDVPTV
jgi:parvulin-like peptidyl-prolyl isomerase